MQRENKQTQVSLPARTKGKNKLSKYLGDLILKNYFSFLFLITYHKPMMKR
jgi:hypothetical protein